MSGRFTDFEFGVVMMEINESVITFTNTTKVQFCLIDKLICHYRSVSLQGVLGPFMTIDKGVI